MNILLLLDMAASANGEAEAITAPDGRLTYQQLFDAAWGGRPIIGDASDVIYIGTNTLAFPISLFASAAAGVPFVPINFRLSDEQLSSLVSRHPSPLVIAESSFVERLSALGYEAMDAADFTARARQGGEVGSVPDDGEKTALLLYTSGTTAAPKAAVLRHRHLTSYIIGSVEFAAAEPDEAVLVSVPAYHIAGVANLLSNLYLGRRVVYLSQFDAQAWLDTLESEKITHAMIVPTMLARICDSLEADSRLPSASLKALSYGGAKTPIQILERAVRLFAGVDLTNAYGLTETSSTIAVLGPDDHRAAFSSSDPEAHARLGSVGKILPTIELEVRGDDGAVLASGETGEVWVRGEQVSGEYQGQAAPLDEAGWFPTRDRGWVDSEGYLFIEGRSDDTIIRGGENIAPAEIEDVILRFETVDQCVVVGVPDEEWGQQIVAVVVAKHGQVCVESELENFVRSNLRGSKTPQRFVLVDELPYTDTGKLLRRVVLSDLLDLEESS